MFQTPLMFLLSANGFTFAPAKEHGGLWDVWVCHANDTYYLFYGHANPGFGIATSKDGVHWKECEPVAEANWRGRHSAFTWKSPNFEKDGKYQCDQRIVNDGRPAIIIKESTDLLNWKATGVHYRPHPRWYSTPQNRWICISTVRRPQGGYYGYCTATAKPYNIWCIGFGETLDGVHWKALPPAKIEWGKWGKFPAMCVELGGAEFINGKYYLMINLSDAEGGGSRMIAFSSDKPEGPFVVTKKNPQVVY